MELKEYYKLEPFGTARGDMQAGIVAGHLMRMFAGGQLPAPQAFIIDFEKDLGPADEEEARALMESQLAAFKAFGERAKKEREAAASGKQERILVPKGQQPPGRVRRRGR